MASDNEKESCGYTHYSDMKNNIRGKIGQHKQREGSTRVKNESSIGLIVMIPTVIEH
jgi:hypothetical protein